jgi:hypothetical protein
MIVVEVLVVVAAEYLLCTDYFRGANQERRERKSTITIILIIILTLRSDANGRPKIRVTVWGALNV